MLVLISGVSGAGKDTVKRALLKKIRNSETLPSYTTRGIREGEVEGQNYIYISKEEFENMIKNNEFYEYNMHHENYYGTSRKLLNEKIESKKIILKDIEVNGTENLIKLLEKDVEIITIFLRVPKEELRRRLENRIDKLDEVQINLRLSRFEYEESKIINYDYVLKNNNLEKTLNIIMTIIENEAKVRNTLFEK